MKRKVVPGTKGKSREAGNVRRPCSCWMCSGWRRLDNKIARRAAKKEIRDEL